MQQTNNQNSNGSVYNSTPEEFESLRGNRPESHSNGNIKGRLGAASSILGTNFSFKLIAASLLLVLILKFLAKKKEHIVVN